MSATTPGTDAVPSTQEAPLMLSVSGLRGLVGRSITPAIAAEYAAVYGSTLARAHGTPHPVVCLGRDSRPSGAMFLDAAKAGLTAVGCRVIDLGIVTTPTVAVMIGEHDAHGGMVVTASHNPIEWNGLKSLNGDGVAPPPDDAARVIEQFKARAIDWLSDAAALQPSTSDDRSNDIHVQRVLELVDVEAIRAAAFTVALDSVNGAGCVAGRQLLESLGCTVHHLNGEPHGRFAHTPEPLAENLTDLAQATVDAGAAVGFAQDPDADRCAIIDETGRYIGEEYTLVLAGQRMLEMRGAGVLAANLSTSRMIDDVAASFPGSSVLRTAVGEANIVNALKPASGLMGGEGNGGVIIPDVCWVRDSLSSMAIVLSLLADRRSSLSSIVDAMPRYTMIKRKFDLASIGGRDVIQPMLNRVAEQYANERVNDADGVRIDFADGWVHLRPSNTEPIMRLIGEGENESRAHELIDAVASVAGL